MYPLTCWLRLFKQWVCRLRKNTGLGFKKSSLLGITADIPLYYLEITGLLCSKGGGGILYKLSESTTLVFFLIDLFRFHCINFHAWDLGVHFTREMDREICAYTLHVRMDRVWHSGRFIRPTSNIQAVWVLSRHCLNLRLGIHREFSGGTE